MASHFKQSYVDDHDYEASASPMSSDSITKLHAGEGARKFAARPKKRGAEAAKPARGILIGIAIAALVVILVGFFILRGILGGFVNEDTVAPDSLPDEVQQVEVTVDGGTGAIESGSITFMDETYSGVALGGGAAGAATDASGNQRPLFALSGTPATLLLYDGILLVPENLSDGWDVIAYVLGGESQASPIVVDDAPLKGQGEITEAHLDGAELVVSDSTGANTRIAL